MPMHTLQRDSISIVAVYLPHYCDVSVLSCVTIFIVCPGYSIQCAIMSVVLLLVALTVLSVVWWNWNDLMHRYRTTSKTLPFISENFVGREDEMQELLARVNFEFTEIRIVSILGSPGFGKSTLAIQLGHRLIDQGVNVHYVNFDEFMGKDVEFFLAEKILKSSDITAKKATFDRLLQWVRDRSGDTLLILDNCDTVFHSIFSNNEFVVAVGKLIQTSKSIKVVTTSRKMIFHIGYDSWYKVYQLSPKAAITLLDKKLPKLTVSLEEKEEIASLTGNVPLALHIVGSLLTLENPPSPETVINELKLNPIDFLSPKDFPIQLRIDASISLSYQYLDDNLKEVALFSSLFPGSFSKHAPIEISTELQNNKLSNMTKMSLTQNELKALVDRSLLEYNERRGRYQYHRLIKDFLIGKTLDLLNKQESKIVSLKTFSNEFKSYFLKQLYLHTIGFKRRYVDSLKFLDTERHNIHAVLKALTVPESLPKRLLLMTIDYVTNAIDVEYLTCRFTKLELIFFFFPTVQYLDSKIVKFQGRCGSRTITDLSGNTWTQKEYYQRIYIKLLITHSNLLAMSEGENIAIIYMEQRKFIVDQLSAEKSPEKSPSYGQQRAKTHSSYNSHQQDTEPLPRPTEFVSSSETNRVQDPDSVPLTTIAQRRLFYTNLGNHYFTLGQHSKVAECQLKILEEVNKCKKDNYCSYRQIGFVHYDIGNFDKAAHFFELSLEHDVNNLISETEILLQLFSSYIKLREWPWPSSEKEHHTLERIKLVCHKLKEEKDQVIFYNWNLIMKAITLVNNNVDFLERKLFSIMSTPNIQFQLKPKDALEILIVVEEINNYTKTIQWGSLLYKPFENYTLDETVITLQIHLSISKAHIGLWHIFKGLYGMEYIYKTIDESQDLQSHNSIHNVKNEVCFYLIIRLMYVIPCYKHLFKKNVAIFTYSFSVKLVFVTFVLPVEFYGEVNDIAPKVELKKSTRSTAVTSENSDIILFRVLKQTVEPLVLTLRDQVMFIVENVWHNYISTYFWFSYKVACIWVRFSINVFSVYIRLTIISSLAIALLAGSLSIFSRVSSSLERILAPLYTWIVVSAILPKSIKTLLIIICDILIFFLRIPTYLLQKL